MNLLNTQFTLRVPPAMAAQRVWPGRRRRPQRPRFDRICAQNTENEKKSPEEIQEDAFVERLQAMKADSEPTPATGFWEGVAEEASLIDWPPLGKALVQTVLVIAIVATTSLMLFGLNAGLTDLSRWYYSR